MSNTNKKFWKTRIVVEVLTEGPEPPDYSSLSQVAEDIFDGDASGVWEVTEATELQPQEMADALIEQGSDPEFLGIEVDDDGKVLEEEE